MHFAAKLLDFALQPLVWVLFLMFCAWIGTYWSLQTTRRILAGTLMLLLTLGWQPLSEALMRPLETQYPELHPEASTDSFAGVIILGGATSAAYLAGAHAQPLINDASERMTAAVALYRLNPKLRIIFTGGEGGLIASGPSEAARARRFFSTMGLPVETMIWEDKSRNTFENAALTAQIPGINKQRPWLLLTSAWHMPRAMGVFLAQGWNVSAYPVDFRTASTTPWTAYSLLESIGLWQLALHEYAGIASYRLLGRM
ncbi:MAG: YdcF family protein [Rhodoferax sp.]|nr:MAG: YdcF family protein [Rhodoferax sp.]